MTHEEREQAIDRLKILLNVLSVTVGNHPDPFYNDCLKRTYEASLEAFNILDKIDKFCRISPSVVFPEDILSIMDGKETGDDE